MSTNGTAELPAGWRIARVGEILKIRNGYAFKSSDYKETGVPLIRQSELRGEVVDTTEAKRVDPKFLDDLPGFIVGEGDLLIGMSGSLGKIAEYQEKEPALQNQRTGLLILKPGYDSKFAKVVLKLVEPQILAEGKGVAVQNVSAKEIEDCTFPLPLPNEQRRIVAEIEKQFTRLDAGVAALHRTQANLKRYRAAVLKAACEGRLVPSEAELVRENGRVLGSSPTGDFNSPSHTSNPQSRKQASTPSGGAHWAQVAMSSGLASPTTVETGEQLLRRILTERRNNWNGRARYREPCTADFASLSQLPEGWAWATVEQLLRESLCNGISVKGSDTPPGIRALRLSAMSNSGFDYSEIRYLPLVEFDVDDLWIREGDFFISRGNGSLHLVGRGTSAQRPPQNTIFPDTMIRMRWSESVNSSGWLLTLWSSRAVRSQIESRVKTTAGIYKIAQPEVEGMVIPLPPLAEQIRIVAEVRRRLSVVDELESIVKINLHRSNHLRHSVLQQAFTGNIIAATF